MNEHVHLNPELYHKDVEQVPIRNGYGQGLLLAGQRYKDVVALCADLTESTRTQAFAEAFPDRFVQIGVAEQNLATVASGMAAAGKIPFITSYAVFSPGRNWEQIRTTICYNNQPVKIIGSHAGVSVGPDGATHQALEDMAIMRVLPGMTVIAPCDHYEAERATLAAAGHDGPVYIRLAREKTPVITTDRTPFTIGKSILLLEGKDVTLIACGSLVYQAMLAAKELLGDGIHARVLNMHTIKPLDEEVVIAAARETGAIVTIEEHQIAGGLGSAVTEVLARTTPTPQEFVGMQDRFGESGQPDELLEHFHLRAKDIVTAAMKVFKRKAVLKRQSKSPTTKRTKKKA
ncbi:MAG: transketolase family protein [Patescibacteria group bacterium]